MEIRAIIVDDEQDGRIVLEHHLKTNCESVKIIGTFSNADDTLAFLKKNPIDLLFLDINMPKKTGFHLLEELGDYHCHIIFVTAYSEYAIKAIKYAAFDYLLKPIDPEELVSSVNRLEAKKFNKQKTETLIHNLKDSESVQIALSTKDGYSFVPAKEIIRCEGDSNYCRIYLRNNETYTATKTLKVMQELLPSDIFFRIHKSHLINLKSVKKYSKTQKTMVVLENDTVVEVSRRNKEAFLSKMKTL